MTSAMTRPPLRRRKLQTKYGLGLEHEKIKYLNRRYLARYDTRRWLRHPSCPPTKVGRCYLPRYRYDQERVTQRYHDQKSKPQTTNLHYDITAVCSLGMACLVWRASHSTSGSREELQHTKVGVKASRRIFLLVFLLQFRRLVSTSQGINYTKQLILADTSWSRARTCRPRRDE